MTLMAAGVCAAVVAQVANADMVAQWDFQTTTNGGTAVSSGSLNPKLFVANFGTGTLYLDGTNGSSNFFVPATGATNTEINGSGGTFLNATGSMSITQSSPSALAIVGGAASVPAGTFGANGKAMVFKLSMTNLQDLAISFAARRFDTGFTEIAIDTSANGTSWSSWTTLTSSNTASPNAVFSGAILDSYGVVSLSATSLLNNAATAYVRFTFTGATASAGQNRMDNFQFNASTLVVPAPGAVALIGLAGLVARRRRN